MVVMVLQQYFHLRNLSVVLCNEAPGRSSSLAVKGEAV